MPQSASACCALVGIALLAIAILIGPVFAPPEFSVLRHSTSQQAGQGMAGAWIMRTGFAGYGVGVAMAALLQRQGPSLVRVPLVLFGAGLVAAAIWSNASILPGFASDLSEDSLHSWASAVVGLAFVLACTARLLIGRGGPVDVLSLVSLAVAVIVPAVMFRWPEWQGLPQRAMFAVSAIFVARQFCVVRPDQGR